MITLLLVGVISLITRTTYGDATGNQFIAGTGTTLATLGQFPSFVIVHLPNNGQCGGFIINSNHVVTAGSCVLDTNRNLIATGNVQIRFGMTSLPGAHTPLNVMRIYVHPLFNPWTFDNDIAVIRTISNIPIHEGPNPTIFLSEINDRIIQDGTICTFVGMAANSLLHFINETVMSRTTCNLNANEVHSQFCVGAISQPGPCIINRGGPLLCNNRVAGILSNGFSCGQHQNVPGIYTQVRRYIPWIMQQFNRTDVTPAGPTPPPTFPLVGGQSTLIGYMSLISTLSFLSLILSVINL